MGGFGLSSVGAMPRCQCRRQRSTTANEWAWPGGHQMRRGGGAAAAGSGTPIRMGNRGGLGSVQVRVSSYEQHISVSAHEMLWKRSIFKMQNVAQNVNRDEGTTERYTEKYDFHLFFYG